MNDTGFLVLILSVMYVSNPPMQGMFLRLKAIVMMSFGLLLLQNTGMFHPFSPMLPCL